MRRLILAAAAALALSPSAVAGTSCYVEGSGAKHVSSTRVSDQIDGAITIAAEGAQIGLGVGCDVSQGQALVGLLARYDWTDVSGRVGEAQVGTDAMWSAAIRGGFRINPGTLVYGLVGIAGTELSLGEIDIKPQGLLYGLGVETDIGVNNLAVGLEWDHVAWDPRTADGDIRVRPDTDIIRLTLKVKLDLFK